MIINDELNSVLTGSVRSIKGLVEFNGNSTSHIFAYNTNLKSFTVDREGVNNKFFGYGICQKLTVKVIDNNSELHLEGPAVMEVYLGPENDLDFCLPSFHFQEVSRDENTAELTITAYDILHQASKYTLNDIGYDASKNYTLLELVEFIANCMSLRINTDTLADGLNLSYPEGMNLEGTETLREILDAAAEVSQSIYYVNVRNELTFKSLDPAGEPVLLIDKSQYFTLKSGEECKITAICNATELGENVIAGDNSGLTAYIRNNPFWSMRDDIAELVEAAVDRNEGLAAHKFSCSWRGNYLVEPGDKISFVAKDNSVITSYFTTDKLTYNGGLSQTSEWDYNTDSNETASNPTTLGETIKYTYAKVDKLNKRIELVASEMDDVKSSSSQIAIDTSGILNSVELLEEQIDEQNGVITEITNKVETQITPEQMTIAIREEMMSGIDSVTTSTGFTFNDEGMTISKTGREMTTTITEDGMAIKKSGQEVLVADNKGVKAENLHATTYLIIGKNSRLEDYNNNRTGCFWIGGA